MSNATQAEITASRNNWRALTVIAKAEVAAILAGSLGYTAAGAACDAANAPMLAAGVAHRALRGR